MIIYRYRYRDTACMYLYIFSHSSSSHHLAAPALAGGWRGEAAGGVRAVSR